MTVKASTPEETHIKVINIQQIITAINSLSKVSISPLRFK